MIQCGRRRIVASRQYMHTRRSFLYGGLMGERVAAGGSVIRRFLQFDSGSLQNFSTSPRVSTVNSFSPWVSAAICEDLTDEELEQEVERITDTSLSQLLPHARSAPANHHRALSLELGEQSVWENAWGAEEEVEPEMEGTLIEEEEFASTSRQLGDINARAVDLLANFDPLNPPSSDNLEELELWLECEAHQETLQKFQTVLDEARGRKDFASLSSVQRQVLRWFDPLKNAISTMQKNYILKEERNSTAINVYGPYICTLPPEKLAVILAHEAITCCLLNAGKSGRSGQDGATFTTLALHLGEAVEQEVVIHRMLYKRFREAQKKARGEGVLNGSEHSPAHENVTLKWAYGASHLQRYLDDIHKMNPSAKRRRVVTYAVRKAKQVLGLEEAWTLHDKVHLGSALLKALFESAKVDERGHIQSAFTCEKRWVKTHKIQSFVSMHPKLYSLFLSDDVRSFAATTNRHKPMIVPPEPWTGPQKGAYKWLKVDLLRYHGCKTQKEALANADLSVVFTGLNVMGSVPWKINQRILSVAQQCWEDNVAVGDIPSQTDFELPPEPITPEYPTVRLDRESPEFQEFVVQNNAFRESLARFNRMKQKNMDLRSLRCSAILKLDQAEKFMNFERIYFPYNMDFRGRAYPCPPHLSNVGSDLCRGMLMFAEAKPLGQRGLYWLKVHLANFAGKDKMTFDERAAFVDGNMDKVRESVDNPFGGDRWWLNNLEDPFQGLATCYEIVNAIDSGDPASYMCSLPVHMDGSCNGLQHYAALGRDQVGGKAVNLCAEEEPQDVYVGVMHEVIRRVGEEAKRSLDFGTDNTQSLSRDQQRQLVDNRAAKLVDGLIDRGVVKRTVMTSVYGVTFIGARTQIQEKIEEKLEEKGHDIDEIQREVFEACGFLARVTMDVIGDLFTGAKETMNWLTTCARLIAQQGHPVAWISPIGLPAIQPYRQSKQSTLVTLLQMVTLAEEADDLPIHKPRQVSAFPPNYVHSLDSSHMLLTALEMDKRGLTFSAVHDSFWTHACDVDEMNSALRDTFVDLYEQPLLENLKKTWEMRYPEVKFPDLPERGDLKLSDVKRSKYFFQ